RLAGPERVEVDGRTLRAKRIVLALGSVPAAPPVPGLAEAGFLTHVTALDQPALPPRIAMLGGGPVGLEFAQTYARLGAQVTVLELLPELLPREDPEVGRYVREQLGREGITALTGFRATRVAREGQEKAIHGADGRRGRATAGVPLRLRRARPRDRGGGKRDSRLLQGRDAAERKDPRRHDRGTRGGGADHGVRARDAPRAPVAAARPLHPPLSHDE